VQLAGKEQWAPLARKEKLAHQGHLEKLLLLLQLKKLHQLY